MPTLVSGDTDMISAVRYINLQVNTRLDDTRFALAASYVQLAVNSAVYNSNL